MAGVAQRRPEIAAKNMPATPSRGQSSRERPNEGMRKIEQPPRYSP
jgi:hypothetical protein